MTRLHIRPRYEYGSPALPYVLVTMAVHAVRAGLVAYLLDNVRLRVYCLWHGHTSLEGDTMSEVTINAVTSMRADGTVYHHLDGRDYVGESCTLDGVEAQVIGRSLEFGIVATWPDDRRVEYAWPTIARVMHAGGSFRS